MVKMLCWIAFCAAGTCAYAADGQALHIDGSSDEAANAAFQAMVDAAPKPQAVELFRAIAALNFQAMRSAHETMRRGESFLPTAARVRRQIDGMTAEEIVASGKKAAANSGLHIQMKEEKRPPKAV